jgi:hypothetical protein
VKGEVAVGFLLWGENFCGEQIEFLPDGFIHIPNVRNNGLCALFCMVQEG